MAFLNCEFPAHELHRVAGCKFETFLQFIAYHNLTLGNGIDERLLGIAVCQWHFTANPDEDDRALLLGPFDLAGKTRKEVVDRHDLAIGQLGDVLLGHGLRSKALGVDFGHLLAFRVDVDVKTEAFHGLANGILKVHHVSGGLSLHFGEDSLCSDFVIGEDGSRLRIVVGEDGSRLQIVGL